MDRVTISEPVNAEQPEVEKFKQFKEYYLTTLCTAGEQSSSAERNT